jgi:hypothetical protein
MGWVAGPLIGPRICRGEALLEPVPAHFELSHRTYAAVKPVIQLGTRAIPFSLISARQAVRRPAAADRPVCGYSPRPEKRIRLPSGSRTINVRAPHGSVLSV